MVRAKGSGPIQVFIMEEIASRSTGQHPMDREATVGSLADAWVNQGRSKRSQLVPSKSDYESARRAAMSLWQMARLRRELIHEDNYSRWVYQLGTPEMIAAYEESLHAFDEE